MPGFITSAIYAVVGLGFFSLLVAFAQHYR